MIEITNNLDILTHSDTNCNCFPPLNNELKFIIKGKIWIV